MGKNKNWFIESTVEAGEVIINDGGSAVDFRIEGDSDANLFVTDGSADKVGIGTNAPNTKLHVTSDTVGELLSVSNHNVSSSTSVSSDTSSMTFHSDSFVLDTGTFQIGAVGQAVGAISTSVSASSLDTELCTAKAAYTALAGGTIEFSNLSGVVAVVDSTVSGNVGKVYYLSGHSSNGTFSPSILEANASRVHVGGDVDTDYVFKVTGATGLVGATTITGATTQIGDLKVGVSGTGHDVTLYGDTANCDFLWDQSADSLLLGANTKGVTLKAYGAGTGNYMHWDEANNNLDVAGKAILGNVAGDVITLMGNIKPSATDASAIVNAYSSSQSSDVFIVNDKNSAAAFAVEADGTVEIKDEIKFTSPTVTAITMSQASIGVSGAVTQINYDTAGAGSKTFQLINNNQARQLLQ